MNKQRRFQRKSYFSDFETTYGIREMALWSLSKDDYARYITLRRHQANLESWRKPFGLLGRLISGARRPQSVERVEVDITPEV